MVKTPEGQLGGSWPAPRRHWVAGRGRGFPRPCAPSLPPAPVGGGVRPPRERPQGGNSHGCYFRKGLRPELDQVNTAEMHFEPKMDARSLPASDFSRPSE